MILVAQSKHNSGDVTVIDGGKENGVVVLPTNSTVVACRVRSDFGVQTYGVPIGMTVRTKRVLIADFRFEHEQRSIACGVSLCLTHNTKTKRRTYFHVNGGCLGFLIYEIAVRFVG